MRNHCEIILIWKSGLIIIKEGREFKNANKQEIK